MTLLLGETFLCGIIILRHLWRNIKIFPVLMLFKQLCIMCNDSGNFYLRKGVEVDCDIMLRREFSIFGVEYFGAFQPFAFYALNVYDSYVYVCLMHGNYFLCISHLECTCNRLDCYSCGHGYMGFQ